MKIYILMHLQKNYCQIERDKVNISYTRNLKDTNLSKIFQMYQFEFFTTTQSWHC